jgi:hypothetical protein
VLANSVATLSGLVQRPLERLQLAFTFLNTRDDSILFNQLGIAFTQIGIHFSLKCLTQSEQLLGDLGSFLTKSFDYRHNRCTVIHDLLPPQNRVYRDLELGKPE